MVSTAIVLAGGFGTRLRPLTDAVPKPMIKVQGKPVVAYIVEGLVRAGVLRIILCVSYKAEQIQDYFGDGSSYGVNIEYSFESEPLGTGGAIVKAAKGLVEPFILVWGDGLMNVDYSEMISIFNEDKAEMVMALREQTEVNEFGVVVLEGRRVISFVNKPKEVVAGKRFVDIGAYILSPTCLDVLPVGKCSIEYDCFEKIVGLRKVSAYFYCGQWFPIDTVEKYDKACNEYISK